MFMKIKVLKVGQQEKLVEKQSASEVEQREWKYVVHDGKLFKALDDLHHKIGHKGN